MTNIAQYLQVIYKDLQNYVDDNVFCKRIVSGYSGNL